MFLEGFGHGLTDGNLKVIFYAFTKILRVKFLTCLTREWALYGLIQPTVVHHTRKYSYVTALLYKSLITRAAALLMMHYTD